jgi:uncharacterized protein
MRRHRRGLAIAGVLFVVALLAAIAAVSWSFSSEVVVSNHSQLPPNATVERVMGSEVVLSRSAESLRPGIYELEWDHGHAIVEGVLSATASTVTRRLSALSGALGPGTEVAIDSRVYDGESPRQAFGLRFSEVEVPGELGAMPAWLVAGRTSTWAIVVHGINGNRDNGLRIVPALHRAGLPTLLITYRDDVGAPRSPDRHHHMGLTEWRDLQAAARYALAHGAKRLVLVGYSMGGAILAQFMERAPLASSVDGVILDAPALDWKAILSFNTSELGLPSFAADPVEWMIDVRIKPNWDSLDALRHPRAFHLPVLLFHGLQDKLVPISTSDAFARELGGWVTYYRVPRAGHTEAWNVDPGLYERRVEAFLERVHGLMR